MILKNLDFFENLQRGDPLGDFEKFGFFRKNSEICKGGTLWVILKNLDFFENLQRGDPLGDFEKFGFFRKFAKGGPFG